jgi:hypothetical protein
VFRNLSIEDQVCNYISDLAEGTEIYASDIAKRFNLSNTSSASRQIGLQEGVRRKGKGVFVKE